MKHIQTYRSIGDVPENYIWERLQAESMQKLFKQMRPEQYYTFRCRRRVDVVRDPFYRQEALDYELEIEIEQVETKVVRMWTIEDASNAYVFKSAISEAKIRLKTWWRKWLKRQAKEFAPWAA